MNKSDFIVMVRASDITGTLTSIEKTDRVVSHVLDMLKESIVKHGSLKIQGFGVFEVVDVPARQGRNPRTGKSIHIPAHKSVKFRPGKELREAVNRER